MNKERLKKITALKSELELLSDKLSLILDDEQEYLDNIPDNLKDGEKASEAEQAVETMTNSIELITDAIAELENL